MGECGVALMSIKRSISLGIKTLLAGGFGVLAIYHAAHLSQIEYWFNLSPYWLFIDVFYGLLGIIVFIGLTAKIRASVLALYIYSLTQIVLISFAWKWLSTDMFYRLINIDSITLSLLISFHLLALLTESYLLKRNVDWIIKIHDLPKTCSTSNS